MKNILLIFISGLLSTAVAAQNANAVFFSEFGETFTIFINGQKQNEEPAGNVRIENLSQEFFQIRVDFNEMPGQGFQANVGAEKGQEVTYIIKKNRKGKYVARVHSMTPIGSEEVVQEQPAPTRQAPQSEPRETRVSDGGEEKTTISTTTTTTGKPEQTSIQMQVPGGGVTINVDTPAIDMQISETTTTTTTTTTSSGSGTTYAEEPTPPSNTGGNVCDWPAEQSDVNQMKKSISSKSFEESKMTTAKQATKGKCLTAKQIVDIMSLFTFEDSKLEYAKFAYDFTYDVDNYYIVNDAFTFSSSIDELNDYLEGR